MRSSNPACSAASASNAAVRSAILAANRGEREMQVRYSESCDNVFLITAANVQVGNSPETLGEFRNRFIGLPCKEQRSLPNRSHR